MDNVQHSQTHLFTLRLWIEDLGEGHTEWRGKAQHVLSGQVRYFRDWHMLEKYLIEMLDEQKQDND